MKGKSLRGIVILVLVVCALLAVAGQATADMSGSGTWVNLANGYEADAGTLSKSGPVGLVGCDLGYHNTYDWRGPGGQGRLMGGGNWVAPAPLNIPQTITYKIYLQHYTQTQGWHNELVYSYKPYPIPAPSSNPGGSFGYYWGYGFGDRTFYIGSSGGYYRLREFVSWARTDGSLIAWEWIGYLQVQYNAMMFELVENFTGIATSYVPGVIVTGYTGAVSGPEGCVYFPAR